MSRGDGERNPHQVARSEKWKNCVFSFRGTEGETCSPKERKNIPLLLSHFLWGMATGFDKKYGVVKVEGYGNRKAGVAEVAIANRPYMPQQIRENEKN